MHESVQRHILPLSSAADVSGRSDSLFAELEGCISPAYLALDNILYNPSSLTFTSFPQPCPNPSDLHLHGARIHRAHRLNFEHEIRPPTTSLCLWDSPKKIITLLDFIAHSHMISAIATCPRTVCRTRYGSCSIARSFTWAAPTTIPRGDTCMCQATDH
jgi:hypothetical protein